MILNKTFRRLGFYSGALAVLAVAVFAFISLKDANPAITKTLTTDVIAATDQTYGNPQAQTILIEYSDFQCPACALYHNVINQLKQDFPNDLLIVFRHFPLPQHREATLAAQASEAAGKQGKFWEMHDALFQSQTLWAEKGQSETKKLFTEMAEILQLDIEKFEQDLNSKEVKDKVQADLNSAIELNLSGTPSLFLNGQLIPNPRSYDMLKSLIENSK